MTARHFNVGEPVFAVVSDTKVQLAEQRDSVLDFCFDAKRGGVSAIASLWVCPIHSAGMPVSEGWGRETRGLSTNVVL